MKKSPTCGHVFSLSLLAMSLSLGGCANSYNITTFEGQTYKSRTAPTLEGGTYNFERDNGQMISIPYDEVRSVNRS